MAMVEPELVFSNAHVRQSIVAWPVTGVHDAHRAGLAVADGLPGLSEDIGREKI